MEHPRLCEIAIIKSCNRDGLLWLGHLVQLIDFTADYLHDPDRPAQRTAEFSQTAAIGTNPQRTVRAARQRQDVIVRQAALGAGFAVGLPVPVLVETR